MPTAHEALRDQVAVLREQYKWHEECVNCEGKLVISNSTDSLKKTNNKIITLNFGSRPREETTGIL